MSDFAPPPPPGLGLPKPRVVAVAPTLGSLAGGVFLPQHIKLIGTLTKGNLVQLTDDDRKHATKPFWFSYFWEECGAHPGEFEKSTTQILAFFNHMWLLPSIWDPSSPQCLLKLQAGKLVYSANNAPFPFPNLTLNPGAWTSVSDTMLLQMLEICLEVGFESCSPKGTDKLPFSTNDFTHAPNPGRPPHVDHLRSALVGSFDRAYFLGWRGDGRNLDTIRKSGGLVNKTQSDDYAKSQNMRQPWHPFSLPQNQSKWFFRLAKEDNCLHTVVSVSTDFKSSCTFPLLNSDYVVLPPNNPSQQAISNMTLYERKQWHKVTGNVAGRGSESVTRFADIQQLYLVVVDTQYFDTQQKQTYQFPEVAVKQIPTDNILACISFIRVHHKTTDPAPLTAFFNPRNSDPPSLDRCRRYCQNQAHARQFFVQVQKLYNDTRNALGPNFHVKWASNGAIPVAGFLSDDDKPMVITKVENYVNQTLWP